MQINIELIKDVSQQNRESLVGTKAGAYLEKAITAAEQSRKLAMVRYAVLSFVHAQHNARSLKKASVETLKQMPTDPQAERSIYAKSVNQKEQSTANREMSYVIIGALIGRLFFGDKELFAAFNVIESFAGVDLDSFYEELVGEEEDSGFEGMEMLYSDISENCTVYKLFDGLSPENRTEYIRRLNSEESSKEEEVNILEDLWLSQIQ